MYSGEACYAVPLAGSGQRRRGDGLLPSWAWMVPMGLGDASRGQAAPLAAMPHPSLCHVPRCATSLTPMPHPLPSCHVPRRRAMSLAAVPPRSTVPASTALFTVQPENKAQMPAQPPRQLAYMQRALTSITTTCKAPGISVKKMRRVFHRGQAGTSPARLWGPDQAAQT